MKKKGTSVFCGTILLLLFPYLVTLFASGKITVVPQKLAKSGKIILQTGLYGTGEIDLEEYVIGTAASQIPGSFEEEAVKAQMILARTYLYKAMGGRDRIDESELYCTYLDTAGRKQAWGEQYEEYEQKFESAAMETAGMVILCDGELTDAMFHRASAGATRDGGEARPYMKSVDSSRDMEMEDFVAIREFTPEEAAAAIKKIRGRDITASDAAGIQIISRDSAGYVTGVLVGAEEYTGDEIAAALELPSPAFSVSKTEKGLKFVTKGSGHGYGLSQWGANRLAEEGKDAVTILNTYFQNISVEKMKLTEGQPEMSS